MEVLVGGNALQNLRCKLRDTCYHHRLRHCLIAKGVVLCHLARFLSLGAVLPLAFTSSLLTGQAEAVIETRHIHSLEKASGWSLSIAAFGKVPFQAREP